MVTGKANRATIEDVRLFEIAIGKLLLTTIFLQF